MTNEATIVFSIIAIAAVLSVGEALAGFGSSVLAMAAGLLVIGKMLARTGVAPLVFPFHAT